MKIIPTTFNANNDVSLFSEYIDIAEMDIVDNILGEKLYDLLSDMEETAEIKMCAKRYICHAALFDAIPNLDLVLTNNGFAVVGSASSNYAPASRDRVASLRMQEDVWREKFKESLIFRLSLKYAEDWIQTSQYKVISKNLYTGYSDFRTHVPADDMKDPSIYRKVQALVYKFLNEYVYDYISEEYYNELLIFQYSRTVQPADWKVLQSVKAAIGTLIRGNEPSTTDVRSAHNIMQSIVTYMDRNVKEYSTYESSVAYKIKSSELYKNEQDHATYFGAI